MSSQSVRKPTFGSLPIILLANLISAVPVVGAHGELIGIVSESDLMRRAGTDTWRSPFWRRELLSGNQPSAANYASRHTRKVADVMTREVITATPEMSLRDVAALLERNDIKQIPIVRKERLAGIISRANVLQALASVSKDVKAAIATSDSMIREELMARLDAVPWAQSAQINIIVHDGTAELWGVARSDAEKQEVHRLAEAASGVRSVHDNLLVRPVAPHSLRRNTRAS